MEISIKEAFRIPKTDFILKKGQTVILEDKELDLARSIIAKRFPNLRISGKDILRIDVPGKDSYMEIEPSNVRLEFIITSFDYDGNEFSSSIPIPLDQLKDYIENEIKYVL